MNTQDKYPDSESPIGKILSRLFPGRGKFSIIRDQPFPLGQVNHLCGLLHPT